MMRFLRLIFLFPIFTFAQVGINQDLPSDAAALDINSQKIMNYGGLKLPVVTPAQRALIQTSSSSDGTMIFVNYGTTSCLEIYDGIGNQWQQMQCNSIAPTVLYQENFDTYISGTGINGSGDSGDYPSAVTNFTLTDLNGTLLSGDYVETRSGRLEANDTNGLIQFDTQLINISGYSSVTFSVDLSGSGPLEYDTAQHSTDATNVLNDFMDVSYSIDGAPFITITDYNGNGTTHHTLVATNASGVSGTAPFFPDDTVTQSGFSGGTLTIRVSFQNWASDEFLYVDNIVVTGN